MKSNEQLAEVIHGLFTSTVQHAGISLPSPERIEDMRRTATTLAMLFSDRIKEEAVILIKLLQDATKEGFENLEAEVKFLNKTVDDLKDEVTKLKQTVGNHTPTINSHLALNVKD